MVVHAWRCCAWYLSDVALHDIIFLTEARSKRKLRTILYFKYIVGHEGVDFEVCFGLQVANQWWYWKVFDRKQDFEAIPADNYMN